MVQLILLIVGFALLIKGADVLVDGASSLARKLRISDLAVGLTVVAFGTSCPELFVNILASAKGTTDIAIANVVGSNIANILLVLGVAAVITPLTVNKSTVWKEIPFSLLAALVLAALANDRLIDKAQTSVLTRIDGLVLLALFVIFIYYTAGISKNLESLIQHPSQRQHTLPRSLLLIVVGLLALTLGADWVVNGAVLIATKLGVNQSVIGLTIVAVGTSLPELATSIVAAFKKNSDIAVGNIVGSNIFNIFLILGISTVIRPLPFYKQGNADILVLLIASFLLFLSMFTGKKRTIDRWEGLVFMLLYAAYISLIIVTRR